MTAERLQSQVKVRVRDLPLLADIGINPDEVGRRQPLVITVELQLDVLAGSVGAISGTVDYRRIVEAAEAVAMKHVPLIETFATRLATECVSWPQVRRASVSIDKPFALTRGLAGTEITLERI